jgi:radical SAM superfamily enzyme YgiQ (UPF0313 family)
VKILLVQPDCYNGSIGFRLAAMPEPLALELLAAAIDSEHDCRILDMRLDRDLRAALSDFEPDVVGVTALTPEVYAAREVIDAAKAFSTDIFTVVGGHHATLLPQDFFAPTVDAIALGEGELNFPVLLDELASGRRRFQSVPNLLYRNAAGEFVRSNATAVDLDMDRLALPRRDLTAQWRDEYFFLFDKPDTSVATGRGCPFRCNFCSVWTFYNGRTRQMSAARVVEELQAVDSEHVTFVDDNFLLNYRREREIAELIKAEGLKMRFSMECRTDSVARHPELVRQWADIGLYAVLLGLEGAGDETLANVNKSNSVAVNDEAIRILQDHGIIIWGAFLVEPHWTADDFTRLRDYVSSRGITHTQFTVLTPLPGTELYKQRKDELLTDDYRCFDALHAVLPTRLDREEFYRQFANLYRQTDLSPYYDMVADGRLTIENCRQGKAMLDAMSQWQAYLPGDPVLGQLARH